MKVTTKILFALILFSVSALVTAGGMPQVRMQTSMGDIIIELDQAKAPGTVANFLSYVNEGFYNGTIFHRVMDGFMIQGGGFTENLQQKPTKAQIQNEADNGLKNLRGTIAMARTNDPHSATAQFFVNVVDNNFLDFKSKTGQGWGYTVFGKVVEGMETVDKIRKMTTHNEGGAFANKPNTAIVIQSVTVIGGTAAPK